MAKSKDVKKPPSYRGEFVEIRVNVREKEKMKFLAREYAHGNLAQWLRYASENVPRKYLPDLTPKPSKK